MKYSKNEEHERSHFNKMALEYEKKYGYNDQFTKYKIKKKVNSFVGLINKFLNKDKLKIVEIGCGTGTYTASYSKKLKSSRVIATDISEEMVNLCKNNNKNKNAKFEVRSAYNTKYPSKSVDVVCGFYVLHHINQTKVKKEILRILKPGGMVYFYEPNILNPIVYLIKSSQIIKKLIGDSSDEWAINPLKIEDEWKGFKVVQNRTSEFVWPVSFLPYSLKLGLDKMTSFIFSKIPGLNLIGGSVEICLIKNK